MPIRFLAGVTVALLLASCASSADGVSEQNAGVDPGITRVEAVEQFMTESFLPRSEAECVVDQLFVLRGDYDIGTTQAQGFDTASIIDDCASRLAAGSPSSAGEAVIPLAVVEPGEVASGQLLVNGRLVDYVTSTPPGFRMGDPAPVLLALPPGGQDIGITSGVVEAMLHQQATLRGWVVVSPALPTGCCWHDTENTKLIPEMLAWLNSWVSIEGGRPHIGGMSNGGVSAFHIVAEYPVAFQSLSGFPGFPNVQADVDALGEIAHVPVRLWVGGDDTAWLEAMQSTVRELKANGGNATLTVYPGEPHVIQSTQDGIAIFDALDALR